MTEVRIDRTARVLGQGAYGVVYRGKVGQASAAIKVVGGDQDDTVATIREVLALLSCGGHPHVTSLLGVGPGTREDLGSWPMAFSPRLFMWLRPASCSLDKVIGNVRNRVRQGQDVQPWSLREARKIAGQIASAVAHMHALGFAHRDVKSANVLVYDTHVELCDMGLARHGPWFQSDEVVAEPSDDLTSNVVTRWYRAPELCVRDASYGRGVDVWALGCLMYELLAAQERDSPRVLFCGGAVGGNSCRQTATQPSHEAAARVGSQLSAIADRGALMGSQLHPCPVVASACALANRGAVSRSASVLLPLAEQLEALLPSTCASESEAVRDMLPVLLGTLQPCSETRLTAAAVCEALAAPMVGSPPEGTVVGALDILPPEFDSRCIDWESLSRTVNQLIASRTADAGTSRQSDPAATAGSPSPAPVRARMQSPKSKRSNKRRALDGPDGK